MKFHAYYGLIPYTCLHANPIWNSCRHNISCLPQRPTWNLIPARNALQWIGFGSTWRHLMIFPLRTMVPRQRNAMTSDIIWRHVFGIAYLTSYIQCSVEVRFMSGSCKQNRISCRYEISCRHKSRRISCKGRLIIKFPLSYRKFALSYTSYPLN